MLDPISPDEVVTKEDLNYWFQGLDYEEGFDPSEVPPAKVRKI